jgi:hypothetical protein
MTFKEKLKILFSNEKQMNFISAKLEDGTEVKQEGEELTLGQPVFVGTPEGDVTAPDGEHKLEDGKVLVTLDGVLVEVKEKVEEVVEEMESIEEIKYVSVDEFSQFLEVFSAMKDKLSFVESELEKLKKEPATESVAKEEEKLTKKEFSRFHNLMKVKELTQNKKNK